jgi:enamine deaminase RidA (YjgF/YER057c/UK114 family)
LAHTTQILPFDDQGRITAAELAAQLDNVLDQLHVALAEARSGLERVVKLNLYLARPEIASEVQRVLAVRFPGANKPAVSMVVTPLPHPEALVAADAVAATDFNPGNAVQRQGNAIIIAPNGTRIYVAGQAERGDSLAEATRKTLESLRGTLRFLGRGDADIVQLKAFLTPMREAAVVRREVAAFFGDRPAPPLVLVEWKSSSTTPIEIELIAWGGHDGAGDAVEYLTPPGMTASPVFSRVARINRSPTIYVSGLYASPGEPGSDPNNAAAGEREVKEVFASLDRILKQASSDFRHLAKATYYVSTDAASAKLNELRPKFYDPQRPPSASKAVVAGLGRSGIGLTLDMIAVPAFDQIKPE